MHQLVSLKITWQNNLEVIGTKLTGGNFLYCWKLFAIISMTWENLWCPHCRFGVFVKNSINWINTVHFTGLQLFSGGTISYLEWGFPYIIQILFVHLYLFRLVGSVFTLTTNCTFKTNPSKINPLRNSLNINTNDQVTKFASPYQHSSDLITSARVQCLIFEG